MKNNKNKIVIMILFMIILVVGVIGITYAFFNYTRIGGANSIRVGRIYFNSNQTSVNLSNVFPISSNDVETDTNNVSTVTINVTGDTTYDEGIEYLLTATNVQNKVNGKTIPISIDVTANNLGNNDPNYFNNRDTATNHIYKVMADETAYTNNDLLVGYIAKGSNGVNGTVTIKAYFDKDKVAISDTFDGTESYLMGTTNEWVSGRDAITTEEWNSLRTQGISFQVKVEANEGIWVEKRNLVMKNIFSDTNWKAINANVTSIEFQTVSTPPANYLSSFDVTDTSSSGPVTLYTVDDGLGNDTVKVVIVGDGPIYAPENCTGIYSGMSKLKTFDSTNFKVDNVVNMTAFFANNFELENYIGLSSWNTTNVTNMYALFQKNYKLINIYFTRNWNISSVTNMQALFVNCNSLVDITVLSNWDTSSVTNMRGLFGMGSGLSKIGNPVIDCSPLANWNVSNVTNMYMMFQNVNIKSYQAFANWNVSKVTNFSMMFNQTSASTVTTLEGLENWDVKSAITMNSMFADNVSLTDASAINNWKIKSSIDFGEMFSRTPVHPEFTEVTGTWSSDGTFTPTT